MLALSTLKENFHVVFRLLEQGRNYSLEYKHNGRVYRLYCDDLGIDVPRNARKSWQPLKVSTKACSICKKLEINGFCINVTCSSQGAPAGPMIKKS